MNKCLLCFHQGWSDIVNCLPLIDYYSTKYSKVKLVIRDDAKLLVEGYIRNKSGIVVDYQPKNTFPCHAHISSHIAQGFDICFHGSYDTVRLDHHKEAFSYSNSNHFVKNFYTSYGIDYAEKVNSFKINRDLEREILFSKLAKEDYICVHFGEHFQSVNTKFNVFSLGNCSQNPFEAITLLEKSKEIHLIDSMWAAACYLLDAKYSMFSSRGIPVFLYPYRDRGGACLSSNSYPMLEPAKLANWSIIR